MSDELQPDDQPDALGDRGPPGASEPASTGQLRDTSVFIAVYQTLAVRRGGHLDLLWRVPAFVLTAETFIYAGIFVITPKQAIVVLGLLGIATAVLGAMTMRRAHLAGNVDDHDRQPRTQPANPRLGASASSSAVHTGRPADSLPSALRRVLAAVVACEAGDVGEHLADRPPDAVALQQRGGRLAIAQAVAASQPVRQVDRAVPLDPAQTAARRVQLAVPAPLDHHD
jgi:hypothetical protein